MIKKILFGSFAICLLVFAGCSQEKKQIIDEVGIEIPEENIEESLTLGQTCESFNGTWIEDARECEYVSENSCENLGGIFNECGSACRNQPDAEICTMQCVPFCSFETEDVEEEPQEDIKICTLEYSPVCGIDGVTYSNSCMAEDVEVAYNGECSKENALAEPKICTREYMPVCGADGVTYSNSCSAGNMTIINQGVCEE